MVFLISDHVTLVSFLSSCLALLDCQRVPNSSWTVPVSLVQLVPPLDLPRCGQGGCVLDSSPGNSPGLLGFFVSGGVLALTISIHILFLLFPQSQEYGRSLRLVADGFGLLMVSLLLLTRHLAG